MTQPIRPTVIHWFRSLWPTCPACKQSMTSIYANKPACLRCCSRRSLTK